TLERVGLVGCRGAGRRRLNGEGRGARGLKFAKARTASRAPEARALPGTVQETPSTLTSKVLGSGDVLLSHGLSPYYHRGCSVSLPCSEWERVEPLRYCHQRSEPD